MSWFEVGLDGGVGQRRPDGRLDLVGDLVAVVDGPAAGDQDGQGDESLAAGLVVIALERVAELVISRRNLAWAISRSGREHGARHYPFMVLLHTGLLVGCLVEGTHRAFVPALGWPMVAVVVLAQAIRWWCIAVLGPRWNTRIVVVPGLPLIDDGPYRWLRHPNYVAVVLEGIALPLVHTGWLTAVIFTVANAGLLRVRISAENAAMTQALGEAPLPMTTPSAVPAS